MNSFEFKVQNVLLKYISTENDKIAVAVSGGCDSLALVLAIKNLNYKNAEAIIVNHNLRVNSLEESKEVSKLMDEYFIKNTILNWHGNVKNNLESEAREGRYKLLLNYCHDNQIKYLCLGHHKNDQIETFIMNLSRGSSLDGLCGMSEMNTISDIKIIRPLLALSKNDCKEYLVNLSVKWWEDETNRNIKFQRNKIRQIISQLNDFNLIEDRIFQTCLNLQNIKSFCNSQIESTYNKIVTIKENRYLIDKGFFLQLHYYLKYELIIKIFKNIHYQNNQEQITFQKPRQDSMIRLISFIEDDLNCNKKYTIHNCILIIKSDYIYFYSEE